MKIALYIEDGLEQIVLTPQTDTELKILEKLHDGTRDFEMKRGSFYETRGGWVRHTMENVGADLDDKSTMIVMRPKKDKTSVDS